MAKDLKYLVNFLSDLGIEKVPHTQKNYLAHLIAVYRFLKDRGCDEEVCRAGLFHSIYGTESFQGFKLGLERRAELRELIGPRAELLAYINCAMDRQSLDDAVKQGAPPHRVLDRLTGQPIEMTTADFDDLCRVHLYDWLEQVARSEKWGWSYRREGFRRMAERLGGIALETYDQVYAQEPAGANA
jgi:hypothetical protein